MVVIHSISYLQLSKGVEDTKYVDIFVEEMIIEFIDKLPRHMDIQICQLSTYCLLRSNDCFCFRCPCSLCDLSLTKSPDSSLGSMFFLFYTCSSSWDLD